jgi:predicted ATP-dependent serine protease
MAAPCRNCGAFLEARKIICMRCGERSPNNDTAGIGSVNEQKTTTLDLVEAASIERVKTGGPWDAVWGGGFVPGSLTLTGGSAGMGKTTLLLQLASIFADLSGNRAYFMSAEQAPGEIRMTAERLRIQNLDRFRVMSEFGAGADIDKALLKKDPPSCLIVDSVSAMCGKDVHAAVSVSRNMKKLGVEFKVPAFLICHMNKQADFAGLYTLQHDVDTIVTVFGPENENTIRSMARKGHSNETIDGLRVLTAWKNRYGPTGKDYYMTMTPQGIAALPDLSEKPDKKKKSVQVITELKAAVVTVAEEPPRAKPKKPPPIEVIEVAGQRLVRRKKVKEERAAAIEGEALKRKRPVLPKPVKAKREKFKKTTAKTKKRKKRS